MNTCTTCNDHFLTILLLITMCHLLNIVVSDCFIFWTLSDYTELLIWLLSGLVVINNCVGFFSLWPAVPVGFWIVTLLCWIRIFINVFHMNPHNCFCLFIITAVHNNFSCFHTNQIGFNQFSIFVTVVAVVTNENLVSYLRIKSVNKTKSQNPFNKTVIILTYIITSLIWYGKVIQAKLKAK